MSNPKRTLSVLKATFLSRVGGIRVPLALDRPVVTFTFDDVPNSAFENGLPILEELGVPATWYVSASFVGTEMIADQVRALNERGQDVQCHSHSHYRLYQGTAEGLRNDAAKNRTFLQALAPGIRVAHFSFPFGEVTRAAKRELLKDYRTLRSVYPGVNRGTIDLGLLRANTLYSRSFQPDRLGRLLRLAEKNFGWLIFYTHGVEESPDAWSCTSDLLASTAEICLEAGFEPLSISQTHQRITSRKNPAGISTAEPAGSEHPDTFDPQEDIGQSPTNAR